MSSQRHTTVLIVDPLHSTRSIRMPRWALHSIAPALLVLGASTLALGAGLAALGWHYATRSQENQQLQQQVVDLRNLTSSEIEAKLRSLSQSEAVVHQLQQYLSQRGVDVQPPIAQPPQGQPNPAAGGPIALLAQPVPYTGNYSRSAADILQAAQAVPLGMPHEGDLSSRFGWRSNPFTGAGNEWHGGLDIKGPVGAPVHVTANGTVTFAGQMGGYGNIVRVSHGHGYTTGYAHLSAIQVKQGQRLSAGDVVGLLGSTGRSTGPHLHYEVVRSGTLLDPESFLTLSAEAP